jgi:hypothetical protein
MADGTRLCDDCGAILAPDEARCPKCGRPALKGINLYRRLVEIRRETVREDDFMIGMSLLHLISAWLTEPANLGVEAPSSEGKTWPVIETSRLFPPEDVWLLGGLSPTALIHEHGILVDPASREPLAPRISELEGLLAESSDKQEKAKIRGEIASLLAKAAVLVDLDGKILLFLDRPNPETLQKLYPLLSHDAFEISYKFTDKQRSGPLRTIHVILRGWPVAIFIRTRGEYDDDAWTQTISRFTTVSPKMTPTKYREGVRLRALMRGVPGFALQKMLRLDEEGWAQEALRLVRSRLLEIKNGIRAAGGSPRSTMVWIPYYKRIGESFPAELGRRMRDSDRFLALIQAHAALNVFSRPTLRCPDGCEYIIAVRDDYEAAAELYFSEEEELSILTGLPRHVIDFFQKVILPLGQERRQAEEATTQAEEGNAPTMTIRELVEYAPKRLGRAFSDDTIRRRYVHPLVKADLISLEPDPLDARMKIIRILRTSIDIGEREKDGNCSIFEKSCNFSLENLKEAWNELKIDGRADPAAGSISIRDADGTRLSLEQLHAKYYLSQDPARSSISGEKMIPYKKSDEILPAFSKSPQFPAIPEAIHGGLPSSPDLTVSQSQEMGSKPAIEAGIPQVGLGVEGLIMKLVDEEESVGDLWLYDRAKAYLSDKAPYWEGFQATLRAMDDAGSLRYDEANGVVSRPRRTAEKPIQPPSLTVALGLLVQRREELERRRGVAPHMDELAEDLSWPRDLFDRILRIAVRDSLVFVAPDGGVLRGSA